MPCDDTHPDALRVQFECLRGMALEDRGAMAARLSAMTAHLSRQAVRETMPGAPEHEVLLRWIELVYGSELAARVAPIACRLGRCQP